MSKLIFTFIVSFIGAVKYSYATCPVCVIAAGAGLGIGRKFGVSDAVIAFLLGSVLLLSSIWLGNFIIKRYKLFKIGRLIHLASFLLHFAPLKLVYSMNYVTYGFNVIFGYDQFLFGIITGIFVTYFQHRLYIFIKKKNGNKPHFSYEKVVMLISFLLLTTILLHIITKI